MNENATTADGGTTILLVDNEHVKELFGILEENGRDTSGLAALINHVSGMEDFVRRAEVRIADMKTQLDTMKELQDHPIKAKLQKAIRALETKVTEIKERISELKSQIIDGCKSAVEAFRDKGVTALDKLASFFHIKNGLQSIKNDTVKGADICDRAIAHIDSFSKEYHAAGRALKNLARLITGKEPIRAAKEPGKLAKAVSAPYRAERAVILGVQRRVGKMIASLDNLEHSADAVRDKRPVKKPTLMERLDAKKKEIKERESPAPERGAKTAGIEI